MTTAPALPPSDARAPSRAPLRVAREHLWWDAARSFRDLYALRHEWDELAASIGAPVYQTWDFCRTWWNHYGARREARVFVFRSENELVGILPMCIDRVRLGPITLRIAKLMGSDHTQTVLDLPVRTSWLRACLDACLTRLVRDERCEAVLLGPLSERSGRVDVLRAVAHERSDLVQVERDRVVAEHAVVSLPETFEDWLPSLSRNARLDLRRSWRRLRRAHEVEETLAEAPLEEFHAFAHMHRRQWEALGRRGHFEDWPDAYAFNRALVRSLADSGGAHLYRLGAGGRTIVRQFALTFGETCHCRLSARAGGESWTRYGLGRVSLVRLAEHMHRRGVRTLDLGTGGQDYKRRLGAEHHDVRSILLLARREGLAPRARLFCAAADLLDRAYYRGWYRRVAPRLPGRGRPLWTSWITARRSARSCDGRGASRPPSTTTPPTGTPSSKGAWQRRT
jgi:CelD/BcsL family acetyltransferase involved in cellulose biosynthesis